MKITFAKLRDEDGWGLRGSKEVDSYPPEEGTTVDVYKKSGDVVKRTMGKVVAMGDDWWLATCGFKKETQPPGRQDDFGATTIEAAAVTVLTDQERDEMVAEDEARLADRNEAMDRDQAVADSMKPADDDDDFNWEDLL